MLETAQLDQVSGELEAVKPMPAVFDQRYVKRLDGPNVKKGKNKRDLAEQLIADIRAFKANTWLRPAGDAVGGQHRGVHEGRRRCTRPWPSFEKGLEESDDAIPSSMVYAYAAIREGLPFANAAPNLTVDIPALQELAAQTKSRSPATT